MKRTMITLALLLTTIPGFAADRWEALDQLHKGEIAGVEYRVQTKALRLKTTIEGYQTALKLGYDGRTELQVRRELRSIEIQLEAKDRRDERAVYLRAGWRF